MPVPLSHMMMIAFGGSNELPVKLTAQSFFNISVEFGPATATGFSLYNNGQFVGITQGGYTDPDEWFRDQPQADVGDDFQARVTVDSGDGPDSGPTLGDWFTIDVTRTWTLLPPVGVGANEGSWILDIRKVGGSSPLVTAFYNIVSDRITII